MGAGVGDDGNGGSGDGGVERVLMKVGVVHEVDLRVDDVMREVLESGVVHDGDGIRFDEVVDKEELEVLEAGMLSAFQIVE